MATKKKTKIIILVIGIVILLGTLLSVFLIAKLPKPPVSPKPVEPLVPEWLKDCSLLAESCINETCQYLSLCQEEGEFEDCQVYDCGENFGVVITKKPEEKPNKIIKTIPKERRTLTPKEIADIHQRCEGKTEILEKKCEEGKLKVKTKVETKGECEVQSFVAKIDSEYQIFKFEKSDNFYNLTLDSCPKKFEVITVGEGGIVIK